MDTTTVLILIVIGLMAGVFGGIFGVGGAVVMIAAAFMIGGYFGQKIALNLPENLLKKIFGIFLILTALRLIFSKQAGAVD